MLNTGHDESPRQSLRPSWPLKFFEARYFDRKAENQPYIEWLRGYLDEGWDSVNSSDNEEEGDDEDDQEDEEAETSGEVQEREDVENGGFDFLSKGFDFFSGDCQDNAPEEICRDPSDSEGLERYGGESITRVFMKGMTGYEQFLPYRNQVDVVAGFCEQALANTVGTEESGTEKNRMILLDDTTHSGGIAKTDEQRRPFRGWLTPNQLREKLGRPRFMVKSKQNNSVDGEKIDIERRILFLPDLAPSTMEAICATVPRSHALALKSFFYEHLTGKASIGVTIPRQGFKNFTFTLHIPFYVLKESEQLLEDTRKGYDGKSLRRSWRLPFLSGRKGALSSPGCQCLYESQISITVTGIDHQIWTAYGSFDTYYGSSDSADAYYQTGRSTSMVDPLAAGHISRHNIIWRPREYYFKVFEIRIHQVLREWRAIIDKVEEDMKRSGKWANLPLDFDDSLTRRGVREISAWVRDMVKLLRVLTSRLGDTVDAWDKFKKGEIGYFLFDDENPTTSSRLKDCVTEVDAVFLDLKDILRKLGNLEKGLCQDSPLEFNAHLSYGNHEAQIFQQKSARHIQVLTVVTIAYLPLTLAANLFSTAPGVLPFTPNFGGFILCFFLLGFLVVASIAVLFKWQRWAQDILSIVRSSRKACAWDVERGREDDHQVSTQPPSPLPNFKSPDFEVIRSSRFENLNRSIYSPLSTNDGAQQDPGEPCQSYIPWARDFLSPVFERIQRRLPRTQLPRKRTPSYQSSPFRPIVYTSNVLKRLFRPELDADKQRIHWTCRCGHELYADLSNRSQEENARLALILQHTGDLTAPPYESYSMNTLPINGSPLQTKFSGIVPSSFSAQSTAGSTSPTFIAAESSSHASGHGLPWNQSYLEIGNDAELFARIRSEYFRLRKPRSNLWLLKPSGINFVKFALQRSLHVSILQEPRSVPPPEEVAAKRYTYSPCPLNDDWLMSSDTFLHYLYCKDLPPDVAWLPRLPKKSDPSIFRLPGPMNEGWGIHITEGPNWFVIGLVNLFMITMSGLAAGLWKLYKNDFQGGFALAGWILGVGNAILFVFLAKMKRA